MNKGDKKRWYIHLDADAFFASVEQCLHPELFGKPVAAGRNGSVVVAMSYEAKALGLSRGIPAHEVLRDFPTVSLVSSDYAMYRLFSDRMVTIADRHLKDLKRRSIDECSGVLELEVSEREVLELTNRLKDLQHELQTKLGIPFSLGAGATPTIAKIASGMNKPRGCTVIGDSTSNAELMNLPIEKVPGFGKQTAPRLRRLGIGTIGQFIAHYPHVANNFNRTMHEYHDELRGIRHPRKEHAGHQSINRARSFKLTSSKDELIGQLTQNIEHLARKLREEKLLASTLYLTLRTKERVRSTARITLPSLSDNQEELIHAGLHALERVIQQGIQYRHLSITLSGLTQHIGNQMSLWEDKHHYDYLTHTIDKVNQKTGKPSVILAAGLITPRELGSHLTEHPRIIHRHPLLPGETTWRRLRYPYLGKISN